MSDEYHVYNTRNNRASTPLPLACYHANIFFFFFKSFYGIFIILFIQYYSVTCRPSDHTVGRPRAEIRTRDGRSRGKDSNH